MSTTDTDPTPETVLYASPAAASGPKWVETPVAYDAILLAGFGGPEGQDDVIPFLRNVTRGRGIPDERLEEVAHHYRHFGGVSPINQHNRELKAALEAEILSVFPRPEILTPDDVRGDSDTLPDALRTRGWPRLDDVRGRVMFALDNTGRERDAYLEGHRALAGRLMFASVDEDDPAAAWFKRNDPIGQHDEIRRLVAAGFLVRTRADADTRQARDGSTAMRDKALASGAQFVSTDYPAPDPRFTGYRVELPGRAVARPNPVSGDRSRDGLDLERGR